MKKVKFGVGIRGALSGGELAVRVTQAASLVCVLFLLGASVDRPVMLHRGPLALLFDLGASFLPRWFQLLLSFLYRKSGSEVVLAFALLIPALIFGLAAGRLLREKAGAVAARKVYGLLILIDLVFRLLPFRFNLSFGWPFALAGFLLRLGCLALIWLDLRAEKARQSAKAEAK